MKFWIILPFIFALACEKKSTDLWDSLPQSTRDAINAREEQKCNDGYAAAIAAFKGTSDDFASNFSAGQGLLYTQTKKNGTAVADTITVNVAVLKVDATELFLHIKSTSTLSATPTEYVLKYTTAQNDDAITAFTTNGCSQKITLNATTSSPWTSSYSSDTDSVDYSETRTINFNLPAIFSEFYVTGTITTTATINTSFTQSTYTVTLPTSGELALMQHCDYAAPSTTVFPLAFIPLVHSTFSTTNAANCSVNRFSGQIY